MNTDKAYLLGLIVGGGVFGNAEDTFKIKLPYKQWGSYIQNPQRASQITRDIMTVVSPMFRNIYGITVSFDASPSTWNILCEGDTSELKAELLSYGIKSEGELRKNTSIGCIVADMVDEFMRRRFVAGLADTIGSTSKSHRRFSNEVQIISFELQGFNFDFVCDLCKLLYSIGCYPDQILWNHPNFHAKKNPYYGQWTKGHKLRVQLDQYASFGAFAFATKAMSAQENRQLQSQTNETVPCPKRSVRATVSCVHQAEHDQRLPTKIRGGHYLHNRHVCAVMRCEHAPYESIKNLFSNIGDLIIPFPILCKDNISQIEEIIRKDSLLSEREYTILKIDAKAIYDLYKENKNTLIYGKDEKSGYPVSEIVKGISFIIADDKDLTGKRPKGSFEAVFERGIGYSSDSADVQTIESAAQSSLNVYTPAKGRYTTRPQGVLVEFRKPDLLTPLIIVGNGRGALVGAKNPNVYRKLVTPSPGNEYKLCVRPIAVEDLRDA